VLFRSNGGAAPLQQPIPIIVHLGLILALDGQGDGIVESIVSASVQHLEAYAGQLECSGQQAAFLVAAFLAPIYLADYAAVPEDRRIVGYGICIVFVVVT